MFESENFDGPIPSEFDPMDRPIWTFVMAVAWVATRNVDAVRWQMEEWRRANDFLPQASIALAHDNEPDELTHSMFFTGGIAAVERIRVKAQGSNLVATAWSDNAGRPVDLKVSDWTFGQLNFDSSLSDCWAVGSTKFMRVCFERDQLIAQFPAHDEGVTTEPHRTQLETQLSNPAPNLEELPYSLQKFGPAMQVVINALWHGWRGVPTGFPNKRALRDAIWAKAIEIQPSLQGVKPPSEDVFYRAETAVKNHFDHSPRPTRNINEN